MHVKKVQADTTPEGKVLVRLWAHEGSAPVEYPFHLDLATALVLAGMLESAVHKLSPPNPGFMRVTGETEIVLPVFVPLCETFRPSESP